MASSPSFYPQPSYPPRTLQLKNASKPSTNYIQKSPPPSTWLLKSEIMKRKGPLSPSQSFTLNQLVWLNGTNVKTTHPKAKLAPKRHGPFKILSTTPTNSRLQLPPTWCIHLVFHNSLLTPYKETPEHGPNYTRPPPEIVEGGTDHYEVEAVVNSRLTPNKRGIRYLVKWKNYPDSENQWIPASGMKHTADLVKQFHIRHPNAPKPPVIRLLQAQRP
jgi:hypothetical protein